jgi:hypothetical protein
VTFNHEVTNDPNNLYGINFLVFDNAFFVGKALHPMQPTRPLTCLAVVEVYLKNRRPYLSDRMVRTGIHTAIILFSDSCFLTQAYQWDQDLYDATGNGWTYEEMDFTKPVDPSFTASDFEDSRIASLERHRGERLYVNSFKNIFIESKIDIVLSNIHRAFAAASSYLYPSVV